MKGQGMVPSAMSGREALRPATGAAMAGVRPDVTSPVTTRRVVGHDVLAHRVTGRQIRPATGGLGHGTRLETPVSPPRRGGRVGRAVLLALILTASACGPMRGAVHAADAGLSAPRAVTPAATA